MASHEEGNVSTTDTAEGKFHTEVVLKGDISQRSNRDVDRCKETLQERLGIPKSAANLMRTCDGSGETIQPNVSIENVGEEILPKGTDAIPHLDYNDLLFTVMERFEEDERLYRRIKYECRSNWGTRHGIPGKLLPHLEPEQFIECLEQCQLLGPYNMEFLYQLMAKMKQIDLAQGIAQYQTLHANDRLEKHRPNVTKAEGKFHTEVVLSGDISQRSNRDVDRYKEIFLERIGIPKSAANLMRTCDGSGETFQPNVTIACIENVGEEILPKGTDAIPHVHYNYLLFNVLTRFEEDERLFRRVQYKCRSDWGTTHGVPQTMSRNVEPEQFIEWLEQCQLLGPNNMDFLYRLMKRSKQIDLAQGIVEYQTFHANDRLENHKPNATIAEGKFHTEVVLNGDISQRSNRDVDRYKEIFQERLGIPKSAANFIGTDDGSVVLVFQLPLRWPCEQPGGIRDIDVLARLTDDVSEKADWLIDSEVIEINIGGLKYVNITGVAPRVPGTSDEVSDISYHHECRSQHVPQQQKPDTHPRRLYQQPTLKPATTSAIHHLEYSNLKIHEEIGKGGNGVVRRVTFKEAYRGYTEAVVKKLIHLNSNEMEMLSNLSHPNIVKVLGICQFVPENLLVLELAPGGSLYDFIRRERLAPIQENLIRKWLKECALAIKYLHENNIIHMDIKSNNCLLFHHNVLKLCDFGLAANLDDLNQKATSHTTLGKTLRYKAPELLEPKQHNAHVYSKYTDIFQYGMLIFEICSRDAGMTIFPRVNKLVGSDEVILPTIPATCPEDLSDLMRSCWKANPKERPTIERIIYDLVYEERLLTCTPGYQRMRQYSYCPEESQILDHRGGKIVVPDTDACLVVPPEAISDGEEVDVEVSVNWGNDYPPLQRNNFVIGPVVSCKPDGLKFQRRVKITLPHSAKNITARHITIWTKKSSGPEHPWKILMETNYDLDIDKENKISIWTDHFTLFTPTINSNKPGVTEPTDPMEGLHPNPAVQESSVPLPAVPKCTVSTQTLEPATPEPHVDRVMLPFLFPPDLTSAKAIITIYAVRADQTESIIADEGEDGCMKCGPKKKLLVNWQDQGPLTFRVNYFDPEGCWKPEEHVKEEMQMGECQSFAVVFEKKNKSVTNIMGFINASQNDKHILRNSRFNNPSVRTKREPQDVQSISGKDILDITDIFSARDLDDVYTHLEKIERKDVDDAIHAYPRSPKQQAKRILGFWCARNSESATRDVMIRAMEKCQDCQSSVDKLKSRWRGLKRKWSDSFDD